jgi:uncharacterized protein (DUF488 family)
MSANVLDVRLSARSGRIFSIGHSTHELSEFIRLLHAHRVGQVADVRAHPGSRRLPWFNLEALSRELPEHELLYAHVPQLGGRRRSFSDTPNRGWREAGFRGYADHMASAEFAAGIKALQALARCRPTAMMCAEGLWWRCHRRLVSDALTVAGWEVVHIAPDGAATTHELTPFAALDAERLTYPPVEAAPGSS